MNVFISYSHADRDFAMELAKIIEADGYDVFIDNKIPIGNNIYRDIGQGIAKADAIIIVISENYNHGFVANETVSMLSFFDKGRLPLIIPVVLGKNAPIPYGLERYNYLDIPYENETGNDMGEGCYEGIPKTKEKKLDPIVKKKVIQSIQLILGTHNSKLASEKEKQKANEKKVKDGLSNYLNETMTRLHANEKTNKVLAYILYFLSIIPLIVATVLTVSDLSVNKDQVSDPIFLAIQSVVSLLIILLFISISKLMFTLAKSFMVESIRYSDRIHAISFGKFFLDAYGNDATREEVLKAFSAWNIDDGKTSFRNQSGDDYDPKLENMISAITDIYKNNKT